MRKARLAGTGLRWAALSLMLAALGSGCSARHYRESADTAAYRIISQKQQEALGRTEPIEVASAADTLRRRLLLGQNLPYSGPMSLGVHDLTDSAYWDGEKHLIKVEAEAPAWSGAEPLHLTLIDALQVAAKNSRDYQAAKEKVFVAALDLDLERDEFRHTFSGLLSELLSTDRTGSETVSGTSAEAEGSVTRKLKSGVELTSMIAVDLVKLLTQSGASSLGLMADATISIPLLRGAGRRVAAEPLTQAERDVIYAICEFERFKRTFAVEIADEYLSVLQQHQQVVNQEENYRSLITGAREARRWADGGKIAELQFDQAVQQELSARDGWIRARQTYASRLDGFRISLGLPTDAEVELESKELDRLLESTSALTRGVEVADYAGEIPPADAPIVLREPSDENAGPFELDPKEAIALAFEFRLDLRTAKGRVEDAQRKVMVAADALRPELTLLGTAAAGERRSISSADSDDAEIDFDHGTYRALLTLDLPLERTSERNEYRKRLIALEQAVRNLQELEDQVKLDVRGTLRDLLESREGLQIQNQAVALAERRVKNADLLLQAGRAEIRDLLEAQEDLLSAQNSLIAAAVQYRIAELELQRDMGLLEVDAQGLWTEYSPQKENTE